MRESVDRKLPTKPKATSQTGKWIHRHPQSKPPASFQNEKLKQEFHTKPKASFQNGKVAQNPKPASNGGEWINNTTHELTQMHTAGQNPTSKLE